MERSKNELLAIEKGYKITINGDILNPKEKILTGTIYNKNYKKFNIRLNEKHIPVKVHRLQAYQKFGEIIFNEDIVVRHLDGNGLNNSWDNIDIGSYSDNMMDKPKEERIRIASNANKKYSDELVLEIKAYRDLGHTYTEIMEKYNINSKGTLSYIINNR